MLELQWLPGQSPDGRPFEFAFTTRDGCDSVQKDGHPYRRSDEWTYIVRRERAALVLLVYTGLLHGKDWPLMRKIEPADRGFHGADLTLHEEFPTSEAAIQTAYAGEKCPFTFSGRCFGFRRSTSLGAGELFHSIATTPGFPFDPHQQVAFAPAWFQLVERFDSWYADALEDAKAIAHLKQCPACRGRGVVEK